MSSNSATEAFRKMSSNSAAETLKISTIISLYFL
jgi:hypothetical protein